MPLSGKFTIFCWGAMSNYAYVCARVKAKKSLLMPKDMYTKIMVMSIPEISRTIGESQYRREIEELAGRYSGVDLIELATYVNLARTYRSILEYCKGNLKDTLSLYLRRWDIWNLKTILRGKFYQASKEEIREDLVPAGAFDEEFLYGLLELETMWEIVDALAETEYKEILINALGDPGTAKTLLPAENMLDKIYYEKLRGIPSKSKANRLLLNFIKTEIDIINLKTLFRLKYEKVDKSRIMEFIIPGGGEVGADPAELQKLVDADFGEFVQELKKFSFYEDIKAAVDSVERKKSLNGVMSSLDRCLIGKSEAFSHLYPLSILPVLDYLLRKKIEIDSIRVIARGKELGLGDDVIKEQLWNLQ